MVDAVSPREMRVLAQALRDQGENATDRPANAELLCLLADAHLTAAEQIEKDAERVPDVLTAMAAILSLTGNVDHSKGNGPNAAEMRGHLLNDIRTIATVALRP